MTSKALKSFKAMIQTRDFVVLDTETTDLYGEVCQIAIVDASGKTLLDTLVKPVGAFSPKAVAVHGITAEMVATAPPWHEVTDIVEHLLRGKNVVVYNAKFDRARLHSSADAAELPKKDWKTFSTWWCAMEAFAEVYGDWNDYHGNYRWQKLTTAAKYYRIPVKDAHSALGDAKMTLTVVLALSVNTQPPEPEYEAPPKDMDDISF